MHLSDYDIMELGPSPVGESCVQVGDEDYYAKARAECQRYIAMLERRFPIPEDADVGVEGINAFFKITSNPHDFGTYLEVAVKYDANSRSALEYALHCEGNLPETWDDDEIIPFVPKEPVRREIEVNVTEEHCQLDMGKPQERGHYLQPVLIAVQETLDAARKGDLDFPDLWVMGSHPPHDAVELKDANHGERYSVHLPFEATRAIQDWYSGQRLQPFNFKLTILL